MTQRRISTEEFNKEFKKGNKPGKYRSIKTTYKSIQGFERTYDSMGEVKRAVELDLLIGGGEVLFWLPQVRFPLTVGAYYADFMVVKPFMPSFPINTQLFEVAFEDVKGRDTPGSKRKRAEVNKLYKIDVQILQQGKG